MRSNDSFNFPLGWIKYIVIVVSYLRNPDATRPEAVSRRAVVVLASCGFWKTPMVATVSSSPLRWRHTVTATCMAKRSASGYMPVDLRKQPACSFNLFSIKECLFVCLFFTAGAIRFKPKSRRRIQPTTNVSLSLSVCLPVCLSVCLFVSLFSTFHLFSSLARTNC